MIKIMFLFIALWGAEAIDIGKAALYCGNQNDTSCGDNAPCGAATCFNGLVDIVHIDGSLIVSEKQAHRIRRIDIKTGQVLEWRPGEPGLK